MNGLDLVLLLATALAVVGGWRLGLITRALGWVGLLLGLAIGVSVVPSVTRWIEPPSDLGLLLLGVGCFVFLASLGQAIGVAIGSRLRPPPEEARVRSLDAAGGAALGVVGVLVLAWLILPLMAQTSGAVAAATRSSFLARNLVERLPDPPAQITDLERNLVGGNFPELFANLRPTPELPPPPAGSPVDAATLERTAASTARLQGRACDLVQSGSGFSVGDGLWVTNSHVVAGTSTVDLTTPDGATGTARVVAFDPDVDLAVLRSDLVRPGLPFARPTAGTGGLVLGFPGGGPFEPSPFLVGDELTATGYDIYDTDLVRRELLVLAAELEPGDSGSALVDGDGAVVGAAVAIAPDRAGVAYALHIDAVDALLATPLGEPVDTGPCLR